MNREDREKLELERVSAYDKYDLEDDMDIATDEKLDNIINGRFQTSVLTGEMSTADALSTIVAIVAEMDQQ